MRKLRFTRWSRARCGVLAWTVFDDESCVDERLLGSERVVVCPYVGFATVETMVRLIVYFLLLCSGRRDNG
jgi:hypothetical protein